MQVTKFDSAAENVDSISVNCPSCQHAFPLSEAVLSGLREGISKELETSLLSREHDLQSRLTELNDGKIQLSRQKAELAVQVEEQVEARLSKQMGDIKAKAEEKALKVATEAQGVRMKELEAERDEKSNALKKLRDEQLGLMAEKRKLLQAREDFELESSRRLESAREEIGEEIQGKEDESNRLKIAEKEKVISELNIKLQEAQRKAEQGSMQTQGEVLELDFEQQLRQAFPIDVVDPIATGARGADVKLGVVSPQGRDCGAILFETKRTKAWQNTWVTKLAADMRNARVEFGVIVTETLPSDISHFGQKDGIWVTDYASAIPLARAPSSHPARGNDRQGPP